MTVTSTKMIQSSSAWLTIVSDFFIKCASFVCLYPFMQLALYISVVRPPFHLFCGGIWAPNLMGKVYFWRILASSTGDYFLAIIRRLSPTRQQLARRLVGEANSGSKTIRSKCDPAPRKLQVSSFMQSSKLKTNSQYNFSSLILIRQLNLSKYSSVQR